MSLCLKDCLNSLLWIYLCIFSSYVGGYICQYTPSAIVHSIIPRQSRQRFSTGTHAVIKVQSQISTLKHTLCLLRLFFHAGIIWQTLDKQTFFHIIAVVVGLHPQASYLCYSILAKHPILHVAPLKAFPFLCFYDSILFLVFWNVFCPLSMSEFITVTFVMLSHHSVVFNSVTFSLLAHHCMSVYTPHSLPIMLCHHLCIPMLVCLSFVVIKSVRSQHNHRRPHYMRVPSEYVCLVEFGYHFEMPVFGETWNATIIVKQSVCLTP